MLSQEKKKELYELAKKAAVNSYSPYSCFSVGSAVLVADGTVFTGTNVENASFGLTICAERTALCSAIGAGHKDILAIAVYAEKGDVSPCGACRQFIAEFGPDIEVIYRRSGQFESRTIGELLPDRFDKSALSK